MNRYVLSVSTLLAVVMLHGSSAFGTPRPSPRAYVRHEPPAAPTPRETPADPECAAEPPAIVPVFQFNHASGTNTYYKLDPEPINGWQLMGAAFTVFDRNAAADFDADGSCHPAMLYQCAQYPSSGFYITRSATCNSPSDSPIGPLGYACTGDTGRTKPLYLIGTTYAVRGGWYYNHYAASWTPAAPGWTPQYWIGNVPR